MALKLTPGSTADSKIDGGRDVVAEGVGDRELLLANLQAYARRLSDRTPRGFERYVLPLRDFQLIPVDVGVYNEGEINGAVQGNSDGREEGEAARPLASADAPVIVATIAPPHCPRVGQGDSELTSDDQEALAGGGLRQWWNELIPAPIASAGATPAISTASGKDVELIADVVVQAVLKTPSGSSSVTKGKKVSPWGGSAVSCPQFFSELTPVFDLYDSQDDAEVSLSRRTSAVPVPRPGGLLPLRRYGQQQMKSKAQLTSATSTRLEDADDSPPALRPQSRSDLPSPGQDGQTAQDQGWLSAVAKFTWSATIGYGHDFCDGGWIVLVLFVLAEAAVIYAVLKFGVELGSEDGAGLMECQLERSAAAQELILAEVTCELSLHLAEMLE
ncbi:hypothetical protein A1Q1_04659 [Trichosporon asahii var. asahii CBS 2479]|uniref:Uncharacterized protein n=1 Tax=Trichosporon asahii var. asahii (strain ATCC 90039 / CBS 2479 / JCM 2466 / KCTC 7840 / NBRC 103889/ NCYC 2677 / UAMH 7654) TaxID=1186058 RepID=J6EQE3_TRIAS|nr:hypothetical protein A1Q1_04659 [Trichosporon asahii var. asahii CBS 2479]EJT46694.1 hypothetical protein A1Q1_04659 [Trichosporon asahii var. asahii CBS 2479]